MGELLMVFVVCKVNVIILECDVEIFVDENVVLYKKFWGGVEFIDEILRFLSGKILCWELKDRLRNLKKL